jgi:hypothetical protein
MSAYTTSHEIQFIRSLGHNSLKPPPYHILLARYAEAIKRRVDWTGIDKAKVLEELARI